MIEIDPVVGWVNTAKPLLLNGELQGQVVLLLFWDVGRVSCTAAVAEAEAAARRFAHEPVVLVGVHDTRFPKCGGAEATRRAIERAGLTFPVAVDQAYTVWRKYTIRSSPTVVVVDPRGEVAARASGEGNRELLERTIARVLEEHRSLGTLATGRVAIQKAPVSLGASGLRGPEKVVAQTPSIGRPGVMAVADTANNRVLVTGWPNENGSAPIQCVFGSLEPGRTDGPALEARFRQPRGMAIDAERGLIYVADTGNHAVRLLDLNEQTVRTILGRSERGHGTVGGATGTNQALHTPMDLSLDARSRRLFIAMTGVHQIWSVDLSTMVARSIVGSGHEGIVDGQGSNASFAQPVGIALSTDRQTLYVVDAEGSALRAVELKTRAVRTVAGGKGEGGVSALDAFGDRDGLGAQFARPLGMTVRRHVDGYDEVIIADYGNARLRVVDTRSGEATTLQVDQIFGGACDITLAGALASRTEEPCLFIVDTDQHRVMRMDCEGLGWTEIGIAGLAGVLPRSAERAAFHVPMQQAFEMRVPGIALTDGTPLPAGMSACFRVSSWSDDREKAVVCQRTLTGSAAAREQIFNIPAGFVDVHHQLLVEVSSELGPANNLSWLARFGSDGGEPRLRR